jgi:hypothetical protein
MSEIRCDSSVQVFTPKVILCVPREDMVLGNTLIEPILFCLEIGFEAVSWVTLEVGDV